MQLRQQFLQTELQARQFLLFEAIHEAQSYMLWLCVVLIWVLHAAQKGAPPDQVAAEKVLAAHCIRQLGKLVPAEHHGCTDRLTAQLAPLLRLALLLGGDVGERNAGKHHCLCATCVFRGTVLGTAVKMFGHLQCAYVPLCISAIVACALEPIQWVVKCPSAMHTSGQTNLLLNILRMAHNVAMSNAELGALPGHSPSASCGTATSAAASSAGSDKVWSSGSNLAAIQTAAKHALHAVHPDTGSAASSATAAAMCRPADGNLQTGNWTQTLSVCASLDSLSASGSNGAMQSSAPDKADARAAVQKTSCAAANAGEQKEIVVQLEATAAVVKAGLALQVLLDPSKLLPLLGLPNIQAPQLQQQGPQLQPRYEAPTAVSTDQPEQKGLAGISASIVQLHSAGRTDVQDVCRGIAQHDMLAMLGLASTPSSAFQLQANPAVQHDAEHIQQQAAFALELVEVLMNHVLCQPEVNPLID